MKAPPGSTVDIFPMGMMTDDVEAETSGGGSSRWKQSCRSSAAVHGDRAVQASRVHPLIHVERQEGFSR